MLCIISIFLFFIYVVIFHNEHVTASFNITNYNSSYQDLLAGIDESTCDFNKTYDLDMSEIIITFLDFENKINITQKLNDFDVINFDFNVNKRLVAYAHGFEALEISATSIWVARTFQDVPDMYLIIISYTYYTRYLQSHQFVLAVLRAYYVGKALGQILSHIRCKGILSQNMHCVGNSLGAQVIGHAAAEYTKITDEKIGRLTGVDPAGLCFINAPKDEQIRSGLGGYVDVYHCSGARLATTNNLADIDFYFNSVEEPQPLCVNGYTFPVMGRVVDPAQCSHRMCLVYWLRTVHEPYLYPVLSLYASHDYVPFAGYYISGNFSGVFNITTDKI